VLPWKSCLSWYYVFDVLGDGNLMSRIEVEEETDGRFIAEVPELPGVIAYGQSRNEAIVKVEALALRVIADRVENGEPVPKFAPASLRPARLASCLH
jgi:predicted RNase H-like HicB family nuclease